MSPAGSATIPSDSPPENKTYYLVTAVGSAGDVLPFVGVGRELRARGHEVSIIAAEPFRKAAESAGLHFISGGSEEDYRRVVENPDLWHPRKGLKLILGSVADSLRTGYRLLEENIRPGRTVLIGSSLAFSCRVFQEKHEIPLVTMHLSPNVIRSEFEQSAITPGRDFSRAPRWVKRAFYWAVDRCFVDGLLEPKLNAWRSELALPPIRRPLKNWFHSPQRVLALYPDWFGAPQPDWPSQVRQTGFPLYDEAGTPACDDELEEFMDAGSPPIVFTPGTANWHARTFFQVAMEATRQIGERGLFLTRCREQIPDPLPEHIHHAPYVPLSRHLPRCRAIVHHGGVGTSAQGLAAGVPQLVMPMAFDQPDNVTRLRRLGVGDWITVPEFAPARVAAKLGTLLRRRETEQACALFREAIRSSLPLARTCDWIEELSSH